MAKAQTFIPVRIARAKKPPTFIPVRIAPAMCQNSNESAGAPRPRIWGKPRRSPVEATAEAQADAKADAMAEANAEAKAEEKEDEEEGRRKDGGGRKEDGRCSKSRTINTVEELSQHRIPNDRGFAFIACIHRMHSFNVLYFSPTAFTLGVLIS